MTLLGVTYVSPPVIDNTKKEKVLRDVMESFNGSEGGSIGSSRGSYDDSGGVAGIRLLKSSKTDPREIFYSEHYQPTRRKSAGDILLTNGGSEGSESGSSVSSVKIPPPPLQGILKKKHSRASTVDGTRLINSSKQNGYQLNSSKQNGRHDGLQDEKRQHLRRASAIDVDNRAFRKSHSYDYDTPIRGGKPQSLTPDNSEEPPIMRRPRLNTDGSDWYKYRSSSNAFDAHQSALNYSKSSSSSGSLKDLDSSNPSLVLHQLPKSPSSPQIKHSLSPRGHSPRGQSTSPRGQPTSPWGINLNNNHHNGFDHMNMNGFLPNGTDIQVHRAKQVYLGNRSHSLDQGYVANKYHSLVRQSSPVNQNHTSSIYANTNSININTTLRNSGDNIASNCSQTPPSSPSTPTSVSSDTIKRSQNSMKKNLQTISESLGSLFKNRPIVNDNSDTESRRREFLRKRSSSVPNALDQLDNDSDNDSGSDNDEDDYGFLSYPSFRGRRGTYSSFKSTSSSSAAAMQKSRSASSAVGSKPILPKRWRKSKNGKSSSEPCSWKPEGNCTWISQSSSKVTLANSTLLNLTDVERHTLQKLALARLQAMDLGCPLSIPKDPLYKRHKSRGFSLKKRTISGGLLDNFKDRSRDVKDSNGGAWVFGIPLSKCILNDRELRRRKPQSLRERRESADLSQSPHNTNVRKSSSSSGGLSCDSMSETDSKGAGSTLLDALSLSSSTKLDTSRLEREHSLSPHIAQVPYVVSSCFKHIETYGLRVVGIFRIGSSKKRTKQLREEFDSGKEVKLNEEHSPHDVGGLLKEYFRDLPNPLLTRDLYSAFIAVTKLQDASKRIEAFSHLVSLLPVANLDTLDALLRFLNIVVQHSKDAVDEAGDELPGNKMDAHNLATLFGPNILHKSKGDKFQVESMERAEERIDVINVVKELIEKRSTLFQVQASMLDDVYRILAENDPEAVEVLLKKKALLSSGANDVATRNSFCDEPENLSIPRNSSYNEYPRSFSEVATPQGSHRTTNRTSDRLSDQRRLSANCRLSAPDPSWYRPDTSHSPASPRISPSPKALKTATPDLRVRVTPEPEDRTSKRFSLNKVLSSPRATRAKQKQKTQLSPPVVNPNTLQVPAFRYSRDMDSSSQSSGYYPGSSRSDTTSPVPPQYEQHPQGSTTNKWYLETPPQTPTSVPKFGLHEATPEPSPLHRTSSTQRPLGVGIMLPRCETAPDMNEYNHRYSHGDWQQKDHWMQWEALARERSEELQEQETLV